ncbi:MAG TPA: hypothetical protein VKB38_08815 [Terracidiphilus sp.]|nr:hypothetical protein [Bryobacteraceae bacterium]HKF47445.1 hypothetical protein [Terracidiphilus sp.]
MRIRRFAWGFVVLGLVAVLSGCGSNSKTTMAPAPGVNFVTPAAATTITFGQAVTLNWQSTDATSCNGSASNAIGSAFNGIQPISSSATIAPTGSGTVTFTLTCSGPGGTVSSNSPLITVNPSILSSLLPATITTVGSTLDPIEMGGNPYGLAIAPATAGLMTKGDLVVCNFNDGATNTQGLGTTIVGLHPTPGSNPYRIAQSAWLQGCASLAFTSDGNLHASAFSANAVPQIDPHGAVTNPLSAVTFAHPWGIAATSAGTYVSNLDGSIDRIVGTQSTQIISGFCGSGVPGAVFAPAGLTYDSSIDALYVVDSSSNSVVVFSKISAIGAGGVAVSGQCASVAAPPTPMPTFSGPSAASARVIAHGGPFIAPLSAALLSNGDLIVTNSDVDIATGQMPNLAIEVSPSLPGGFVGTPLQLDTTGIPGGLFGIVATTDAQGNQWIYFNDDNANAVMSITQ